ncbi:hypothetical protein ACFSQZ_01675 [Rubritalea spongiae]|uniref:Glycosyl-4,4'-diaponeurosporenoate acyltransferase n=2 Tax=Rubritalea spongiae TaxID=430797 RepID=A0ABW5DZI7_9BACT
MLIELPNVWTILGNVILIPTAHLFLSWLSIKLPSKWFQAPTARQAPSSLSLYEKCFHIKKWKKLLPDAAPMFDGFSKKRLASTEETYLIQFVTECRRGQFSHWSQWCVISSFIVWNPWPACIVILLYSGLSNLPCILNLRYTELRIYKFLDKKKHT